MNKTIRLFRKGLALLIGIPLLIVGLILIPLPGPGILICLAAFFILSREFEWARKHMDKYLGVIKGQYTKAMERKARIEARYAEPAKDQSETST